MREMLSQQMGAAVALVGLAALVLVLVVLFFARRRGRDAGKAAVRLEAQSATVLVPASPPQRVKPDPAALLAAIHEAETMGRLDPLPDLYLSLAQCRFDAGESTAAEELLRKCILGAGSQRHKATHASARLALGDLAHAAGDATTACEHWQIARALFYELKQPAQHSAAEQRMLRNGCPTDWVLTDF